MIKLPDPIESKIFGYLSDYDLRLHKALKFASLGAYVTAFSQINPLDTSETQIKFINEVMNFIRSQDNRFDHPRPDIVFRRVLTIPEFRAPGMEEIDFIRPHKSMLIRDVFFKCVLKDKEVAFNLHTYVLDKARYRIELGDMVEKAIAQGPEFYHKAFEIAFSIPKEITSRGFSFDGVFFINSAISKMDKTEDKIALYESLKSFLANPAYAEIREATLTQVHKKIFWFA